MVRGRREAEDLGVATPVWGPVPEPYILEGKRRVSGKTIDYFEEKTRWC